MKTLKMSWAILRCVFTDPMSEHYIYWEDDKVKVVTGRKWVWQELMAYYFGPRIDR